MNNVNRRLASVPIRAALFYVLIAGLWITVSDRILSWTLADVQTLLWWQTVKGILFVLFTGLILYGLLRSELREVQRANDALRLSEERARALVENSLDAILLTHPDGPILAANPAACQLFGRTEDELKALGRDGVVDVNDPNLPHLLDERLRTGSFRGEVQLLRGDGTTFPAEVTSTLFRDANDQPRACVIIRDISRRKQAESARAEAEARFSLAFDTSPIVLSISSLAGRFLNVNKSFEQLLGYSREEVVDQPSTNFQMWNRPEQRLQLAREMQEKGVARNFETQIRTRSGDVRDVLVSGNFLNLGGEPAVLTSIVDVTERKRAEQAQLEAEQLLSQAMEASPVSMAVIAMQTRRISYVNRSFERLFGYSREETVGRTADELGLLANPSSRAQAAQQVRQTGEDRNVEAQIRTKSGELRDILGSAGLFDTGDTRYALTSHLDITELKQAEQRYRTLFEAMAQGVVYQNPAGDVITANPAAERILGLTLAQMLRQSQTDPRWHTISEDGSTLPPEDHPSRVALKTGEAVHDVVIGVFHPAEEEYRWLIVNAIPQFHAGEGQPYQVFATFDDITEYKRHEQELETIVAVSAALRAATTREELVKIVLDYLIALLRADGVGLVRVDSVTHELEVELGRGSWANRTGLRWTPDDPSLSAQVMETRQPYLSHQGAADPRLLPAAQAQLAGIDAFAILPVIAEAHAIGVLWVGRKVPFTPAEVHLASTVADIAASAIHRQELLQQMQQHVERLTILRSIDVAITSSLDLHIILNVVLKHIMAHLATDAVAVQILNPHSLTLHFAAGQGFRSERIKHSDIRLGQGLTGRATLEQRTLAVPDLREVEEHLVRRYLISEEGFVTYHAVPLLAKGQPQGVLELFHRSAFTPDQSWLDFGEIIAGQVAIAIDSVSLFERLQRSNVELALAYDATIEGWSHALDLRDKETEGHSLRVTEMAVQLARTMGMSEEELLQVRRGALLHDIGKMGIPDSILLKPGALDDAEWEIMRRHPTYGHEMLAPIEFLRPALAIPYMHHEKWDGTGYPRGLKGEEIALEARIFAVVDVWDALTSDRPYRKAWTDEKAAAHIQQQAGIHFDPKVVDIFLTMLARGEIESA